MTLYLIASNVYASVQAPASREFSYIEEWMVGIQVAILLAIFEYAIILAINKSAQEQKDGVQKFRTTKRWIDHAEQVTHGMDKWTMILSGLFFLFFNIYYWITARKLMTSSD